MNDRALSARLIAAGLRTRDLGRSLEFHDTLGSTNELALKRLGEGAPHGHLVLADTQTTGRGRRGRSWHSPAGTSISATLVLRSPGAAIEPTLLVAAVGLGLAEGLERATGVTVGIKWPNDLWIGERKVAGILVESRGSAPLDAVVVGFGVNVRQRPEDFPEELRESATSLAAVAGRDIQRTDVLAVLLETVERRVDVALAGGDTASLCEAYRNRSIVIGRRVRLFDGDEPVEGVVDDLSATQGLLLRTESGFPRHVRAEHAREVRLA